MKLIRRLLPLPLGLVFVCAFLLLLQPRSLLAVNVTITQTTVATPLSGNTTITQTTITDFNRGTFYRTGMTNQGDGEITLLRVGIAGDWITTTNSTSLVPRYGHASVQYNERIYVFGGNGGSVGTLRSIQYATINPSTHNLSNWLTSTVSLAPNIYPNNNGPTFNGVTDLSAVMIGNRVYLLGGNDGSYLIPPDGTSSYSVVSYASIDPSTGALGPLQAATASLPRPIFKGRAVALNGRIYYIGGESPTVNNQGTNTVYYATPNPTTGDITAWFTGTANYPYPLYGQMAVEAQPTNRIYAMAGVSLTQLSPGGPVPYVYYAEPLSTTGDVTKWYSTTVMPFNIYGGAAVYNSGQIYAIGGAFNNVSAPGQFSLAAFEDTDTNVFSWTQTSEITPARFFHTTVVDSFGYIYVVGGSDGFQPINRFIINSAATSGASTASVYARNGNYLSPEFDVGKNYKLVQLSWHTYLPNPSETSLAIRYRTRLSGGSYGNWSPAFPATAVAGLTQTVLPINLNARYLQYQALFTTTNILTTPILTDVSLTYFIPQPPKLSKSAAPPDKSVVKNGDRITYTLSYTNTSGDVLNQALILDAVPSDTAYVPGSIFAAPPVVSNIVALPNLIWNLGNVPQNVSGTVGFVVTVSATITQDQTIANSASFESDNAPNASSNTVVHFLGPQPHLTKLHQTSAPPTAQGTVQPGDFITYTLVYSNPPQSAALQNLVITDQLPVQVPAQVTYLNNLGLPAPDLSQISTGLIRWLIPSVPSGSLGSVGVVVRVNSPAQAIDGDSINNRASMQSTGRLKIDSNVDSIPIRYRYDLQVSKAVNRTKAPPGSVITYTIYLTNVTSMPFTATNILVQDSLSPGLPGYTHTNVIACVTPCPSWTASGLDVDGYLNYSRTVAALGPGKSVALTMAALVLPTLWTTAPDVLAVENSVTAQADPNHGVEINGANQYATVRTTVAGPDIVILRMKVPARVNPNQQATILVTVQNNGFTRTIGSDGFGWFGMDLYVKQQAATPPERPNDRFQGYCKDALNYPCTTNPSHYFIVNYSTVPGAGGLAADQVFTATFTLPITLPNEPAQSIYSLYAQADTFWAQSGDPSSQFGSSAHGRVLEGDERNNVFGPIQIQVGFPKVFMPVIRKNS